MYKKKFCSLIIIQKMKRSNNKIKYFKDKINTKLNSKIISKEMYKKKLNSLMIIQKMKSLNNKNKSIRDNSMETILKILACKSRVSLQKFKTILIIIAKKIKIGGTNFIFMTTLKK